MNKTAKQMFEELGYSLNDTEENMIRYERSYEFYISFELKLKRIYVSNFLSFLELKAINKQMEELKWLGDDE